ncbi:Lyzozyme M1 (1,4-beta-N-acetylmuramidase) [Lachnoclostridium sp. An169]|uniref:glycoside hydrolase family 25 protein n=1 Tax=Lachnoclostridium sp. An169 TaxID=1965569 RepID=UPI000B3AFE86|nr:glycoside hydrolase family 25 protein [Lachnoclostridium sp. An169]OUP86430.1 Lyzozyme M1 (1,4-beta-N-acetylmuramidase) [Lachnoclostridium sp. An169]
MKKSKILSLILGCALLTTACQVRGGENAGEDTGDVSGITIEEKDGTRYFHFQDVEENEYEAELLETVPECTYNFEYLFTDDETGYKSFADAEDGVTAEMGIDVSEFQGEEIDWKQVKKAGVEFVIVRLGYRAYGESGDLVLDAMFERNVQGALDAGLDVGVYFFSQAITASEAVEEAEYVLGHIRPYDIDGPVVYDTEDIKWDTARTDENTDTDFTNFCKVFCDIIESEGYDSMIYANLPWMAFTLKMDQLAGYDFWYADYHELPQCPYDYKIWQYSENGKVPGIKGNVDLNLWFQEDEKE